MDIGLQAGDRIQDGHQFRLAVGGLEMRTRIDKETARAGLLRKGVTVWVKMVGQSENVETEVKSVSQMTEGRKIQVTIWAQEGRGRPGGLVSLIVNMESGTCSCVVPIETPREDNKGYYCPATEPKRTILGDEQEAMRIQVDVLEKSSFVAAVLGPVIKDMKLITESSEPVSEGDRVGMVEEWKNGSYLYSLPLCGVLGPPWSGP